MGTSGFLLAASGGLSPLDYVLVVTYLAGMVGMGVYFSGRQTTTEEYFVGRRTLSPTLVGISLIATLLSSITYLAAPGDMIQHGLAFATTVLSLPMWLAVVALVWVPFFMRYRLTSIYEYAEMRFNRATRWLAAGLFIAMRFGWMGMIVYTVASATAEMTSNLPGILADATGWEMSRATWTYTLMLGLGSIATVYTFLGGIRVVIWTDAVQFLVMVGGAIFAIFYIWGTTGTGPAQWWAAAGQLERAAPVWVGDSWTTQRTVLFVVMNAFFWRVCTHCADQVATQRYFTAGGTREAISMNIVGALGDFVMTVLLGLVGLALLSFFTSSEAAGEFMIQGKPFDPTNGEHAKQAYPAFIVEFLPQGVAGIVMAALFAAAMSSIDSGINSIAAVVTTDFYRGDKSNPNDDAQRMRIARWTTLLTGLAITGVAYLIAVVIAADEANRNIIDLSIKVFNLFLGPLAAIFMVGIFCRWVGSAAIITATVLGVASAIGLGFWEDLSGTVGPSALVVTPLSTVATVVLGAILGLVFPRPDPRRIDGHTWWTRDKIVEVRD